MSKQTNCILVHQRAEAVKATDQAELHRVSSMLAAGWGASSTVLFSQSTHLASASYGSLNTPSVWRSARSQAAAKVDALFSEDLGEIELPAFLQRQPIHDAATLREMAEAVVKHLQNSGTIDGAVGANSGFALHPAVAAAIRQLQDSGLDEVQSWLLLTWWVITRPMGWRSPLAREECLRLVGGMPLARVDAALQLLSASLGSYSVDSWVEQRAERLRQALDKGPGGVSAQQARGKLPRNKFSDDKKP